MAFKEVTRLPYLLRVTRDIETDAWACLEAINDEVRDTEVIWIYKRTREVEVHRCADPQTPGVIGLYTFLRNAEGEGPRTPEGWRNMAIALADLEETKR